MNFGGTDIQSVAQGIGTVKIQSSSIPRRILPLFCYSHTHGPLAPPTPYPWQLSISSLFLCVLGKRIHRDWFACSPMEGSLSPILWKVDAATFIDYMHNLNLSRWVFGELVHSWFGGKLMGLSTKLPGISFTLPLIGCVGNCLGQIGGLLWNKVFSVRGLKKREDNNNIYLKVWRENYRDDLSKWLSVANSTY